MCANSRGFKSVRPAIEYMVAWMPGYLPRASATPDAALHALSVVRSDRPTYHRNQRVQNSAGENKAINSGRAKQPNRVHYRREHNTTRASSGTQRVRGQGLFAQLRIPPLACAHPSINSSVHVQATVARPETGKKPCFLTRAVVLCDGGVSHVS